MARYIERQLHHQRQLLTLELPEMLENRSQSLNDRFCKMLGFGDEPPEPDPDMDLADWRVDTQSIDDRHWGDEDEDDHEHGLRGSAGDLLFDGESQPFINLANAHIEVVDALPSPACETAEFAVISYTSFCLSLSLFLSLSKSLSLLSRSLSTEINTKLHTNALNIRSF